MKCSGSAGAEPSTPAKLGMPRRNVAAPGYEKARALAASLAGRLPVNLRRQFATATTFEEGSNLEDWARYAVGLRAMLLAPDRVIAALDRATVRYL